MTLSIYWELNLAKNLLDDSMTEFQTNEVIQTESFKQSHFNRVILQNDP